MANNPRVKAKIHIRFTTETKKSGLFHHSDLFQGETERGGGAAAETDSGIAVINHRNFSRLSGVSARQRWRKN